MSNTNVTITIEANKKGIAAYSKISYARYLEAKEQNIDLLQLSAENLIKKLDEQVPDNDQKDSE